MRNVAIFRSPWNDEVKEDTDCHTVHKNRIAQHLSQRSTERYKQHIIHTYGRRDVCRVKRRVYGTHDGNGEYEEKKKTTTRTHEKEKKECAKKQTHGTKMRTRMAATNAMRSRTDGERDQKHEYENEREIDGKKQQ